MVCRKKRISGLICAKQLIVEAKPKILTDTGDDTGGFRAGLFLRVSFIYCCNFYKRCVFHNNLNSTMIIHLDEFRRCHIEEDEVEADCVNHGI